MLFEIIGIILALYAVTTPFWVLKSIKFGMKCASEPEKAPEEPIFIVPKPAKKVETPEEVRRMLDILDNIEAYDGTPNGQKEIK